MILFAGDSLNIYHKHALVGENDLIANGLEALNNLFARYEETRRLRANLRCGHFFKIK